MKNWFIYQRCLPAPLPVSRVVSEPPQVPVGFDDFWTQDVILLSLSDRYGLYCAIKLEGFGTQLQCCNVTKETNEHNKLSVSESQSFFSPEGMEDEGKLFLLFVLFIFFYFAVLQNQ